MAKCNQLTSLAFKGLKHVACNQPYTQRLCTPVAGGCVKSNALSVGSRTALWDVLIVLGWSSFLNGTAAVRHVRKTWNFFSKYADHVIAKYAAKICRNRPRLYIRINLTWYIFGGDGIAQSLFSKFAAYQSLESTCIGLIGSNNFFNLQQQIVCIIVRHVHLTTNIDYPQIRKLDKFGN